MCTYSAVDGMVNDFHLVHLGKFAQGGFGLVFVEATAVHPDGRITHGDVGLWDDKQIDGLKRVASFIKSCGAAPGIQLAHAGRKASTQRPWRGNGPLTQTDRDLGDEAWRVVAPSSIAMDEGWLRPDELSAEEIAQLVANWRDAAVRAVAAGFATVEIHGAHGYLLHQFLSPVSNHRTDEYGGSAENRMRFPLQVAKAVRSVWPANLPLFFRVSATDGLDGGWTIDNSVQLARQLKLLGIDVVDCSSGGVTGPSTSARLPRGLGFQVPLARQVRQEAGIPTMAVGLILDGNQANAVLQDGAADLIAIGRQALVDPNWALSAAQQLAGDELYEDWPHQYGWWLIRRARTLARADDGTQKA